MNECISAVIIIMYPSGTEDSHLTLIIEQETDIDISLRIAIEK